MTVFAIGNDHAEAGKGLNLGTPANMPTNEANVAKYGVWIAVVATNFDGTAIASYLLNF